MKRLYAYSEPIEEKIESVVKMGEDDITDDEIVKTLENLFEGKNIKSIEDAKHMSLSDIMTCVFAFMFDIPVELFDKQFTELTKEEVELLGDAFNEGIISFTNDKAAT